MFAHLLIIVRRVVLSKNKLYICMHHHLNSTGTVLLVLLSESPIALVSPLCEEQQTPDHW